MGPKQRKQWSEDSMKRAILAVRAKEMGLQRASKHFEVPKSTLRDKVNNKEENVDKLVATKLGRNPILSSELEEALVKYSLEMEKTFYGLTTKDIKIMAFQLSERNGLQHPFNKNDGFAGWKWLRSFLRRHPQLTLRKPQATSMSRVKGFTQESVNKFFDIFEPLMGLINHSPNKLYNCDETGLTIVQHKTSKVIALKGKHQVSAVTSAERGALVTVVTCMSAAGHFIPPLMVFPRVNMKKELLDGAPNGTIAACHKSGWIQMDSFFKWFEQQFLKYVKPTKDDPVILVLDGHCSHTRNLELLDSARENGVHIVCLPPHCTHKMQPLDRAFMYPFKTYYSQAVETWMKQNVGRVVTHYQVARLLGEAYNKAAGVSVATSGFRKTGLFPCNRSVFEACDFSSETSRVAENNGAAPNDNQTTSAPIPLFMPSDITPIPSIQQKQTARNRGRPGCPAAVLTSSPYRKQLSENIVQSDKAKRNRRKPNQDNQAGTSKNQFCQQSRAHERRSKRKMKKQNAIDLSSSDEDFAELFAVTTDEEDGQDDDWQPEKKRKR